MELSPMTQLFSMMLLMLLVVSTGTAWFIALHPQFIWRILQGDKMTGNTPPVGFRAIRLGGFGFGAVGIALLLLAELHP